jgi:hypothetical protein
MGRQQKNIILAVVALVILGALVGVYLWQQNEARKAEAEAAAQPTEAPVSLKLIEHTQEEIEKIEFINEHGSYVLLPRTVDESTTEWYLQDYPDIALNQSTASSQTLFARALNASSKVLDTVDNTTEYGINPSDARAIATYKDGSTEVVHVGKMTPDQRSYYLMVEGDPALYLLSSGAGAR